jgi:GxxExxY protein
LGPGLLESVYEACLAYELTRCDLYVDRQRPIPLVHQEVKLDCGHHADLIVERRDVVEIKAVESVE